MKLGIGSVAVATALSLSLTLGACDSDPVRPPDPGGASKVLPTLGATAVAERFTAEIAVRGDWAYTTTWGSRVSGVVGNAVKVWNVAGANPQLVDSLIVAGARTTSDVQISDDGQLLVVSTEASTSPGSLAIYDRGASPSKPVLVTQYTSANTVNGVHTVKLGRIAGRHYAFLSVNPPAPRIVALDITDPGAPTEALVMPIGSGGPGELVHDVHVRDGLLFAALWDLGVVIFDIGGGGRGGTVASPVRLGAVVTAGGNVHNIAWFHDPATGSRRYAFVGQEIVGSMPTSSAGDIHVLDVSDLTAPREVAFYRLAGAGTHNFSLDEAGGVLYAAYYNGGVRALDIRGDLAACTEAQRAPDGRCDLAKMGRELAHGPDATPIYMWGVQYQSGVVYASDMWNGIWKLDASGVRQ